LVVKVHGIGTLARLLDRPLADAAEYRGPRVGNPCHFFYGMGILPMIIGFGSARVGTLARLLDRPLADAAAYRSHGLETRATIDFTGEELGPCRPHYAFWWLTMRRTSGG